MNSKLRIRKPPLPRGINRSEKSARLPPGDGFLATVLFLYLVNFQRKPAAQRFPRKSEFLFLKKGQVPIPPSGPAPADGASCRVEPQTNPLKRRSTIRSKLYSVFRETVVGPLRLVFVDHRSDSLHQHSESLRNVLTLFTA